METLNATAPAKPEKKPDHNKFIYAAVWFAADDSVVRASVITVSMGRDLFDDLRKSVDKAWPDGAAVCRVFTSRDRMGHEFRKRRGV